MKKYCSLCYGQKKSKPIFHYSNGSVCGKHNKEFLHDHSREGKLEKRTIDIIKKNGKIVLKKDQWYLSCWCNIAAGPDKADWSGKKNAMEIFSLLWAFTIAPLYKAKVVVIYPKGVGKHTGRVYHLNYGTPGITPV